MKPATPSTPWNASQRTPSPKAISRCAATRIRPSESRCRSVGAELRPIASGPSTTKDGAPDSTVPAGAAGMAHAVVAATQRSAASNRRAVRQPRSEAWFRTATPRDGTGINIQSYNGYPWPKSSEDCPICRLVDSPWPGGPEEPRSGHVSRSVGAAPDGRSGKTRPLLHSNWRGGLAAAAWRSASPISPCGPRLRLAKMSHEIYQSCTGQIHQHGFDQGDRPHIPRDDSSADAPSV